MDTKTNQPESIVTAYYDLKNAPITFDFCQFIVAAAAYARSRGQYFFDLVIVADGFRNITAREQQYTLSERRWRLWNLTIELTKIVPQVRDVSVLRTPLTSCAADSYPKGYNPKFNNHIPYDIPTVRKAHDSGIEVRVFKPSEYALAAAAKLTRKSGGKYVTITLRKAEFDAVRDSRVEEWYEFSHLIKKHGYEVIVIPDQDDALGDETINEFDWRVLNVAAMSVDLRLALYTQATMNYVTNGGAIGLFLYSNAPFMWYSIMIEESKVATAGFYRNQGIEVGEKFPWLGDNQRMIWKPDTLENLKDSLAYF